MASQRPEAGVVTVVEVEAELPQPAAIHVASANENSRGVREFTSQHVHDSGQNRCGVCLARALRGGRDVAECYYGVLQRNTI